MNKKEIIGICEFLKIHHFENAYNLLDYIEEMKQENKQLKKQKDDVVDFIKIYRSYEKIDNKDYLKSRDEIGTLSVKQVDDLLRMLGEKDE